MLTQQMPPTTPLPIIQSSTVQKNSTNSFEEIENKINATIEKLQQEKRPPTKKPKKNFYKV